MNAQNRRCSCRIRDPSHDQPGLPEQPKSTAMSVTLEMPPMLRGADEVGFGRSPRCGSKAINGRRRSGMAQRARVPLQVQPPPRRTRRPGCSRLFQRRLWPLLQRVEIAQARYLSSLR
jgi:hypothetical protein